MGRPKISFAVGKKRKVSVLLNDLPAPDQGSASDSLSYSSLEAASEALVIPPGNAVTADALIHSREAPPAKAYELSKKNAPVVTTPIGSSFKDFQSGAAPKAIHSPQRLESGPVAQESKTMTEPPAKRAKRTDSSAMWDRNERPSRPVVDRDLKDAASGRDRRDERDRDRGGGNGREDRRHRSRSRDRTEKRRERSRSREHDGGRYRNGDKGRASREARGGRDRRDRERSTSKERQRPRRDDPPPRSDRHRSRSRSPARNSTNIRVRSPPRKSRVDAPKKSHSPPPKHASTGPSPPSSETPTGSKASTTSTADPDKMQVDSVAPTNGTKPKKAEEVEEEDPELAMMRKMMGFAGFKSTKNTKVPGNDVYAVRKEKKAEYRQYMNRVGGFNRPLSPSR